MFLSKCAANYAPLTPLSMFKRTVLINPNATAYVHAFKADHGVHINIMHILRMILMFTNIVWRSVSNLEWSCSESCETRQFAYHTLWGSTRLLTFRKEKTVLEQVFDGIINYFIYYLRWRCQHHRTQCLRNIRGSFRSPWCFCSSSHNQHQTRCSHYRISTQTLSC